MSDHLPLIVMLKQTKFLNKELLTFESQCLNDTKLKEVNHCLMDIDWIGVLNGTTSNDKFNQFYNSVNGVLDRITLKKAMRISAKCRYIGLWMTKGLEKSSNTKMKLYRATLLANDTEEDITKNKHHRNLYNKPKRSAKEE